MHGNIPKHRGTVTGCHRALQAAFAVSNPRNNHEFDELCSNIALREWIVLWLLEGKNKIQFWSLNIDNTLENPYPACLHLFFSHLVSYFLAPGINIPQQRTHPWCLDLHKGSYWWSTPRPRELQLCFESSSSPGGLSSRCSVLHSNCENRAKETRRH